MHFQLSKKKAGGEWRASDESILTAWSPRGPPLGGKRDGNESFLALSL